MILAVLIAAGWCVVSVPLGVVVGRVLAGLSRRYPEVPFRIETAPPAAHGPGRRVLAVGRTRGGSALMSVRTGDDSLDEDEIA